MKKFLVFAFNTYYPRGGLRDFQGSFDTLPEAVGHAEALRSGYGQSAGKFDTVEIHDRDSCFDRDREPFWVQHNA